MADQHELTGAWYRYARVKLYQYAETHEQEAVLTREDTRQVLGRGLRLNRTLQQQVINELIASGLARRIDRQRIAVRKGTE